MAKRRKLVNKPPTRKPSDSIHELKLLIYGATGAGKTHLLGTATKMPEFFGKCLLIAPDPGDLTLKDNPIVDEEHIDVAVVHTWEEVDAWLDFLDINNRETKEYGTVMFDGITDLVEMMILQILEEEHDKDSRKDRWKTDLQQWGKVKNVTVEALRSFRDLPMHVIFTALEREMKDESTGITYTRPGVRGDLANNVGAYFDIVGHLHVPTKKKYKDEELSAGIPRILTVQNIGKATGKDRSGKLGFEIENPTLPMMVEMLQSGERRVTAPPVRADIKVKKASV